MRHEPAARHDERMINGPTWPRCCHRSGSELDDRPRTHRGMIIGILWVLCTGALARSMQTLRTVANRLQPVPAEGSS